MLPDIWRSVNHLLVLCGVDNRDDVMPLNQALRILQTALPEANITLLTLHQTHYEFLVLSDELDDSIQNSFDDQLQLIWDIRDRSFDAAIVFTAPSISPYSLAYLCYLAGIPIRLGQSSEFAGGVLSHCVQPPLEPVSQSEYYLHLLRSTGFPIVNSTCIEDTKQMGNESDLKPKNRLEINMLATPLEPIHFLHATNQDPPTDGTPLNKGDWGGSMQGYVANIF